MLGGLAGIRCGAPEVVPPDVLVLMLDTLRGDHCSFLDGERATTPEMERFVEGAIVFEDAWAPSAWTLPSHASLFTGLLPSEVGFGDGTGLMVQSAQPLLAERLKGAGWRTACFTNNPWIGPHTGASKGFEKLEMLHALAGGGSARAAHDRAFDWMSARRRDGERFFAFVNDMEAHAPWNPPAETREQFVAPDHPESLIEALSSRSVMAQPVGEEVLDPSDPAVRAAARDLYDGEVAGLDLEVGRLLDRMSSAGLLAGTMVIIVSDHGEGLGQRDWLEHGMFLNREALRVPLVVRLPDGGGARRVSDVVRLEDVMPTILEACGLEIPAGIRGLSLLGDTAGRLAIAEQRLAAKMMPRAKALLGEDRADLADRARRSIYDGELHLLVDDAGRTELFDVGADPQETQNLAADRSFEVKRLRSLLDRSANDVRSDDPR